MDDITEIGRRFRAALALRGLTQAQAIEREGLNLAPSQVSRWIRQQSPSLQALRVLAQLGGTTVSYLIGETDTIGR